MGNEKVTNCYQLKYKSRGISSSHPPFESAILHKNDNAMKELPEVGKTRLAEYKAIRPLIPHDLA